MQALHSKPDSRPVILFAVLMRLRFARDRSCLLLFPPRLYACRAALSSRNVSLFTTRAGLGLGSVLGAGGATGAPPNTALPQGFFSNKEADAKARGVKLPDAKDKEAEFQASHVVHPCPHPCCCHVLWHDIYIYIIMPQHAHVCIFI